jgi:hypothetical protein
MTAALKPDPDAPPAAPVSDRARPDDPAARLLRALLAGAGLALATPAETAGAEPRT